MTKQWQFSGGLALTAHKQVTAITNAPPPKELIYPLLQRADHYVQPIVRVGEHVLKGQIIATANNNLTPPVHAASSGTVTTISPHFIAHPSGLRDDCIIIDTDGLDTAIPESPLQPYQQIAATKLRELIHQAGIVGLGGGSFPTAQKLHTTQPIHTLIINGAECEPHISCDASLVQQHAQQVIQGALILQTILAAERCIIAIEDNMPAAQQALATANQQAALEITTVPAIYPTGGEKQLIQVLTGIKIPAQTLPAEYGFICQNVGTAYAVYQAIVQGQPLTERIITITGSGISQPKNIRARIGTPIKHLIAQCGGYTQDVQRLIMGGSMMGIALGSDDIAITKASNCILALSATDLNDQQATLPCIRCGACADVCPVQLLPQQLYWHSRAGQTEQCQDYQLFDCIECGCCDIVCPSHIPLVQTFRASKGELIIKVQRNAQASLAKKRYTQQQLRKQKAEQAQQLKAAKRKAAIEKMKAASLAKRKQL
ncbi:MAG: electron transport complex subunit RsxC [Methyloprofundus sp.]|nr:electron transport complex subunit RsxC [Methyloprofundus sp.]